MDYLITKKEVKKKLRLPPYQVGAFLTSISPTIKNTFFVQFARSKVRIFSVFQNYELQ